MTAISGIFLRDRSVVDTEQIEKMNKSLDHRGPDGSSIWVEGSIGLGHQMLFTTPESLHEKLPYEKDGLVITADARIDNREELSQKLGIEDVEVNADSYFILKAYQKWGENCAENLLGDFAFAIWDKYEEILFCARDHMGVKPFYYYLSDDILLFASEINAIREILEFEPKLNENMIAEILVGIYNTKTTYYKEIFRLPPAHEMIIENDNFNINRYWHLDPDSKVDLDSEEEYKEEFLKLFLEAVRCRVRSAFPIGSHLSGGLDSSSIVSAICKIREDEDNNEILQTYTGIFSQPEADECFYVKSVLKDRKIEPNFINGNNYSPLLDIEDIIEHSDMPFDTPNNYLTHAINTQAQKDGLRVVLTGTSGDVLLSSPYPYITELFRTFHWMKFYKELSIFTKRFQVGYFRGIFLFIIIPFLPKFIKNLFKKIIGTVGPEFYLNKDLVSETDLINTLKKSKLDDQEITRSLNKYHYDTLNSGLISITKELVDSMSTISSVEMRYPFLDKNLVEFSYAIPSEFKVRNGWDRYLMRRSMEGILPKEVQWRLNKSDYSTSFYDNLFDYEVDNLFLILKNNEKALKKYVKMEEILRIYDDFQTGEMREKLRSIDYDSIMRLWNAVILGLWLEKQEK